jgi:CBS domain-containing protein
MEEPISAVAGHQPIVVTPETSVGEAVRLMKQRRIGCVLVVSGGRLAGIFTERDLLLKLIGTDDALDALYLRDYMTPGPETVEGGDSLRIALNKMSVGGFRHIPVVAEGQVTGLVTAKDALKYLAREALKK